MHRDWIRLAPDLQLEYVEHGPPDGTPMVLLHGVTDSWRSFEALLPQLPSGIRAFAVTVRGHGDSSRPDSGYLLSDMSRDIASFLDVLDLDGAVLVGHSMGASLAQRFAIDYPDRVRAIVLIGAFASMYQEPGLAAFFDASIATLTDPIDRAFARDWQLSTLAQPINAERLEVFVDETLKVPARVWKAAFSGFLATRDFADQLKNVPAPTLLIWGDRDAFVPQADQYRLLATLPDARLAVYRGFGHAVHWEDPARVADEIATFLAKHVPGRPSLQSAPAEHMTDDVGRERGI
jgi:pimeloyl-ACP methyl ester carboxylesterase